jgi:tetratricopeptide (TPR) repeat protein
LRFPELDEQRAIALIGEGRLAEAESILSALISNRDATPRSYVNLAAVYGMTGRPARVVALMRELIRRCPDYPEAHNNMGNALKELGLLEEAISAYTQSLKLKPQYPDALNNLGNALKEIGDTNRSIEHFQRALRLDPQNPYFRTNLSHVLLLVGRYEEGWSYYEDRFRKPQHPLSPHARPGCQLWDGSELSAGDRLLVVSEQGLGDTLQFVRYVKTLRERGLEVSLCVQDQLRGLMVSSGLDPVPITEAEAELVVEGYWIPMMSLPGHLGVKASQPLEHEPYLRVNQERVQRWRERFANEQRPLVGINWQGNPSHEQGASRGRSLPLEAFAPLASVLGGGLVSLQKGAGSEQLEACSFRHCFVGCQAEIDDAWDFEETAAILANCDLVISSDTSVVHLAGGMGVRTWLLLKDVPEWRWGLEGEETFWYPSMRLFRQRERGNWEELMQRLANALHQQLHDWALQLLQGQRLKPAEQLYRRVLQRGRPDPAALLNLATICALTQNREEAIRLLQDAIRMKPEYIPAYCNLGNILKEEGRYLEAISAYRHALSVRPDDADILNSLGIALRAAGQPHDAVSVYQAALIKSPSLIDAWYNQGNALYDLGQFSSSVESYERALELAPDRLSIYNNLGASYQAMDRLDDAILAYQRAAGSPDCYLQSTYNIAGALQQGEQFEKAANIYREAIEVEPHYAEARYNLSLIQLLHGDYHQGWSGYAFRFSVSFATSLLHARPGCQLWDGSDLSAGEGIDGWFWLGC